MGKCQKSTFGEEKMPKLIYDSVIQIEIWKRDVLSKVFDEGLSQSGMRNLLKNVSNRLEPQGISLPTIDIIEKSDLKPYQVNLWAGLAGMKMDARKDNLSDEIVNYLKRLQINYADKTGLNGLLGEIAYDINNNDFQEAIDSLIKTYYFAKQWACAVECVKASLCYGALQMLGGNYGAMLYAAQVAEYHTSNLLFVDPYLKCFTNKLLGESFILLEKPQLAIEYLLKAYENVKCINVLQIHVDILFHIVTTMINAELYDECRKQIDLLYSLVKDSEYYSKDSINQLYEFRALVSDLTINQLKSENSTLKTKYDKITRNFLLKTGDTVMHVVKEVSPSIITYSIGAMFGNTVVTVASGPNNTISVTNIK